MSDVERYEPERDVAVVEHRPRGRSLTERARDLAAAYDFGKALAETSFAPAAFRGKPYEAAAAILSGDEVGLSPMQALRSVYVVSGTPAMYARAMVALVMSHGHEIWTEEDTPTKVTVCGRRRGSEHVERVTWTHDRARIAGYTSNKKYTTDPQAMLYARAASDVARRIAPDVLLGLAYSAEEIELSDVETTTVARAERPTRLARKPLAAAPEPEPEPTPEPVAARPQRTLRRVDDVELPEPPLQPATERSRDAEPQPAADAEPPVRAVREQDGGGVTPTGDRPGFITKPQLKMLHVMLGKAGLGDDRDAALRYYVEHGGTGRTVESSKDLSRVEAQRIIDALVQQTEMDDEHGDGYDADQES